MASAAAGSLAAVVRTTARSAAVDGVARTSGAAPVALGEGLEELGVGFGGPELVGEVRLHQVTRPPLWEGTRDGRQRRGECPFDVPVLLRIRSQLALRQGARFPATIKGVR